jgi:hypothetical protein
MGDFQREFAEILTTTCPSILHKTNVMSGLAKPGELGNFSSMVSMKLPKGQVLVTLSVFGS